MISMTAIKSAVALDFQNYDGADLPPPPDYEVRKDDMIFSGTTRPGHLNNPVAALPVQECA